MSSRSFLALAAAVCWSVCLAASEPTLPEVTTGRGTVRGVLQTTIHGREFEAYLGVPYANPPVGQLRFKEAEPKDSWKGLWNATVAPNQCMQKDYFSDNVIGSEDCLYVNVYTPKSTKKGLDVLVYIHGGGFQFLTGAAYGPEYIMDRDVVYVTFNYRLGTLGFLSFEDDELPGNNGLKDQNLALKWVKENVAAFGGDPQKITISGMSAGGASVHYHILSKKSKGLFQKAIMTSGSVSNSWATSRNVGEKSLKLAAELGCLVGKSSEILECLRERPAERITRLSDLHRIKGTYFPISPIGPMIEKPGPSAFIDNQPYDIIRNGEANDVPILWTVNSEEGLFPGAQIIADETGAVDKEWDAIIPHILDLNFTASPKQQIQIAHQLREHYLGGKRIRDAPGKFTELLGDRYFYNGIHEAAKLHAEHGKSPVWFYRFSYVGGMRLSDLYKISDIHKGGACHGDDAHYVLRAVYSPVDGRPEDVKMINTMVDIWLSFMQGSIPSSWKTVKSGLPDLTFLDIVCSDPSNNVVKTAGRTAGQELWLSFNLPENSNELVKARVHTEL